MKLKLRSFVPPIVLVFAWRHALVPLPRHCGGLPRHSCRSDFAPPSHASRASTPAVCAPLPFSSSSFPHPHLHPQPYLSSASASASASAHIFGISALFLALILALAPGMYHSPEPLSLAPPVSPEEAQACGSLTPTLTPTLALTLTLTLLSPSLALPLTLTRPGSQPPRPATARLLTTVATVRWATRAQTLTLALTLALTPNP